MLGNAYYRNLDKGHLVRLLLVFSVAFAAVHVALHAPDASRGDLYGNDECQVCRLNHVPVAFSAPPAFLHPLQLLTHLDAVEVAEHYPSHLFHSLWARAPPLF